MLILIRISQRGQVKVGLLILRDALREQGEFPQSCIAPHVSPHLIFIQGQQAVYRARHILGRFTGHGGGEDGPLPDAQYLQMLRQPLLFLRRSRQTQDRFIITALHYTISLLPFCLLFFYICNNLAAFLENVIQQLLGNICFKPVFVSSLVDIKDIAGHIPRHFRIVIFRYQIEFFIHKVVIDPHAEAIRIVITAINFLCNRSNLLRHTGYIDRENYHVAIKNIIMIDPLAFQSAHILYFVLMLNFLSS